MGMTREIFKDKALSLLLGERFLGVKLFEAENIDDYMICDDQGEMNLDDFLDRFYTLLAVEKWIKAEELEDGNADTYKKLFQEMRDPTPEEREVMNKALRDMSYKTGVTIQGLINHETYVPMSKINEMRSEIKKEVEEIYVWENDDYAIGEIEMGNRILDIVDKYLGKERTDEVD